MTGHTCPFCGGHVIAHRGMYVRTPPDPRGLCEDCGAYGPKRSTGEEAIRALCEIGRAPGILLDVAADDLRAVSYVVCAGDKPAAKRVYDAIVAARDACRRAPHAEHSDRVLAKLRAMTPEELRRTFIDAGIFDESGNLTEPYRG